MYKNLSVVGSIAARCAVVKAATKFPLNDDFSVDDIVHGVYNVVGVLLVIYKMSMQILHESRYRLSANCTRRLAT